MIQYMRPRHYTYKNVFTLSLMSLVSASIFSVCHLDLYPWFYILIFKIKQTWIQVYEHHQN